MLGKTVDAQKYDALADDIRTAFTTQFYHADSGTYADGSQTTLSCALYQGLAQPQTEARIIENLVASIDKNNGHLDFGLLGSKYVLNTLSDHGRADVAYTAASQKTAPSWGYWVEQGATTLLEG